MPSPPIAEYLKLGRIEFAGLLYGVMLTGALSIRGPHLALAQTLPHLAVALLTCLWSFAHNDYHDVGTDARAPHLARRPLVSGAISPGAVPPLAAACILANVVIVGAASRGFAPFAVLAVSALLGGLYNRFSKRLPGMDLLLAASTALLCLLGALMASHVPAAALGQNRLLHVVVAIHFWDHLVFNAGATLKDAPSDTAAGARTLAAAFGASLRNDGKLFAPTAFQAVIVGLRGTSLLILWLSPLYTGLGFNPLQRLLLTVLTAASGCLLVDALRRDASDRQAFGRRWVRQEACTKLLLPALLLGTAGWGWCLVLAAAPLLWFFTVNGLLYRKWLSLPPGF